MIRSTVFGLILAASLAALAGPASACSVTNECANGLVFKHYTSEGPATDTMAIFLHGDVSRGGNGDYMLSSAQRFVKDVPGAHAVVLIRPGYFDRDNRTSEGSDCGRRDCYTEAVVATVADAMAQLKERFGAKTILGFGHSGGSAILANIMGRRSSLMAGAVLTSCPCDIRSWKPDWTRSLKADEMRAVNLPHFKMKLRDISRELFIEHGWSMPRGLVVEPQQVVLVECESADGCFGMDAAVWSMPVVVVEPARQLLGSAI